MFPTALLRPGIVACLLAGSTLPAIAQDTLDSATGMRVRFRSSQEPDLWRHGTLRFMSDDSVTVLLDGTGTELALPRASVDQLEVSAGRRSGAAKGAGVGFAVGALLGLAAGIAAASSDCFGCEDAGGGAILGGAFVLGGLGAGLGAVIGSISPTERWQPIGLRPSGPVSLGVPRRWRVGLRLAY